MKNKKEIKVTGEGKGDLQQVLGCRPAQPKSWYRNFWSYLWLSSICSSSHSHTAHVVASIEQTKPSMLSQGCFISWQLSLPGAAPKRRRSTEFLSPKSHSSFCLNTKGCFSNLLACYVSIVNSLCFYSQQPMFPQLVAYVSMAIVKQ